MLSLATEADTPEVLFLIKEFFKQSPYGNLSFSDETVLASLSRILQDRRFGIVILWKEDEKIVGLLIAVANPTLMVSGWTASELCFYILPEYRKGVAASELYKAYEYWAEQVGCSFITMVSLANEEQRKLDIWYRRKGFKPVEQTYMKEF